MRLRFEGFIYEQEHARDPISSPLEAEGTAVAKRTRARAEKHKDDAGCPATAVRTEQTYPSFSPPCAAETLGSLGPIRQLSLMTIELIINCQAID